ncbi:MAG: vitamin K epoxide reductase family protein, partial [Kofleriaceae bacterium]
MVARFTPSRGTMGPFGGTMKSSAWLILVLVGAVAGLVFAGVSTYDFVQHLDRQVHDLHCSFIPGLGKEAGATGCQVAMMSPYSSIFRSHVWGGIPISLGAMSVFAFLAFYAGDLLVTRRKDDPRATAFLALATALPALTSIAMLIVSITKLGTTCKLCVAIYVASALCSIGAVMVWRQAVRAATGAPGSRDSSERVLASGITAPAATPAFFAGMMAVGVAFVVIPVLLYLSLAPDNARFIGTCDALAHPEDPHGVLIKMGPATPAAVPAIEVLDPLCPACKAFEQRLDASGLEDRLARKAVLFPLDNTCNWMVTEATHPGACTVSEAVLCAGDRGADVIRWAFENQEQILAETKANPAAAAKIVSQRFPDLAACLGSPDVRARLNRSLRWAVANNVRVLTPQLFVDNVKLCDEDVDLGLEFALSTMLDRRSRGALIAAPIPGAPAPVASPEPEPVRRAQASEAAKPVDAAKPVAPAAPTTPTNPGTADQPVTSPSAT